LTFYSPNFNWKVTYLGHESWGMPSPKKKNNQSPPPQPKKKKNTHTHTYHIHPPYSTFEAFGAH